MAAIVKSIARGRFYYGWTIVAVGFAAEFVLVSLRFYGLSVFVKPMSQDLGWSRAGISGVLSFGTVVEGIISPLVGPIIDKRGARGMQVVLIALPRWPSFWLICFTAIYAGFCMAGNAPIQEVFWANYFGRLSLGAVRSIASPFSIISSAGGPFLAGWVYDSSSSYQIAWAVFAVTYAVGTLLIFVSRPPKKAPRGVVPSVA